MSSLKKAQEGSYGEPSDTRYSIPHICKGKDVVKTAEERLRELQDFKYRRDNLITIRDLHHLNANDAKISPYDGARYLNSLVIYSDGFECVTDTSDVKHYKDLEAISAKLIVAPRNLLVHYYWIVQKKDSNQP